MVVLIFFFDYINVKYVLYIQSYKEMSQEDAITLALQIIMRNCSSWQTTEDIKILELIEGDNDNNDSYFIKKVNSFISQFLHSLILISNYADAFGMNIKPEVKLGCMLFILKLSPDVFYLSKSLIKCFFIYFFDDEEENVVVRYLELVSDSSLFITRQEEGEDRTFVSQSFLDSPLNNDCSEFLERVDVLVRQ